MKKLAFVVLWTFVFLCLSAVGLGVGAFVTLKGDPAKNKAIVDAASRKWAGTMFWGSALAAVTLSGFGLLPGTRRRPTATAESDAAADCDYPQVRPTIVVPISALDDMPPELAALGPPRSVHRPGFVGSFSGVARLAVFVLGLLLFFAPVAANIAVHHGQLAPAVHKVLLMVGPLTGLICLAITVWPRSPYTYRVHDDALIVYDRKTLRIIYWDQIQSLNPEISLFRDLALVTCDGHRVPITNVRGYHQLKDTLFLRVRQHLLPQMVAQANAGRMVEFGPLGVSIEALTYKGRTIPWDDVTRLVILTGSGYRHLTVYRGGLLSFSPSIMLNLNLVPNHLMLLELLKQIAPPTLLVPADPRW